MVFHDHHFLLDTGSFHENRSAVLHGLARPPLAVLRLLFNSYSSGISFSVHQDPFLYESVHEAFLCAVTLFRCPRRLSVVFLNQRSVAPLATSVSSPFNDLPLMCLFSHETCNRPLEAHHRKTFVTFFSAITGASDVLNSSCTSSSPILDTLLDTRHWALKVHMVFGQVYCIF